MDRAFNILLTLQRGTSRHGQWMVKCLRGSWSRLVGDKLASVCRPADMAGTVLTVEVTDEYYPASYVDTMAYTLHIEAVTPRPGDANVDSDVNVGDVVYLINYIFKSGPEPAVPNWADANADCLVNVGDAVFLVNFVFSGGPAPPLGCVE